MNSIKVIDSSASCGEAEYIPMQDIPENREILHKLGISEERINEECSPAEIENTLDLSMAGFEFAESFNKHDGFIMPVERAENGCNWCKGNTVWEQDPDGDGCFISVNRKNKELAA